MDKNYSEILKKNAFLEKELSTIEEWLAKEHYVSITEEKEKIGILVEEVNYLWKTLLKNGNYNFGGDDKKKFITGKLN